MTRLIAALALAALSGIATAQYPSKPIKIIVPFPAGSATDTISRILGASVSGAVGQPARRRDEHRQRQCIRDDDGLHPQRRFAEAHRHGWQRRVDDGRVQRLHEHGNPDEPQQRTEGGGCGQPVSDHST